MSESYNRGDFEWVMVPRDAIERAIETLENDGDEHGEGRNLRAMLDAAQQPAACPKCGGTGEADSGGIMPWGAPAMILCECQQPASVDEAKPLDDWHDDDGPVVWWKFPVDEPAWIGTPNDSDWPEYHTHWTPHPAVPALTAQQGGAE